MKPITLAVLMHCVCASLVSADLSRVDVPLTIRDVAGVSRTAEPCSTGVPLPAGLLQRCEGIAVFDAGGKAVPAQFRALERWREFGDDTASPGEPGSAGGSIKWLGVTFLADVPAGGEAVYRLKAGENPSPPVPVRVGSAGAAVTMGGMKFQKDFSGPFQLVMIDAAGRQITAAGLPITWEVVESGPVRATVRAESPMIEGRFGVLAWLHAYAGLKRYDLTLVVKNTHREPRGPLCFRDLSVVVAPPGLGKAARWSIGGEPTATFSGSLGEGESVRLYQDSDGTDRWEKLGARRDYNAAYVIPWSKIKQLGKPAFRGYRVTSSGKQIGEGNYALGWSALSDGTQSALLAVRHFRENYPSAVEVRPGRLIARLWPDQWEAHGGIHWLDDLQRKRHDLSLRLADGAVSPAAGNAAALGFNRPLIAHCGLAWYRRSGVFGRLLDAKPAKEIKVGVYPGPFAS